MGNREMALEDGTFLISPERYKKLTKIEKNQNRLLPVHKDFRVISLCLPVPKYSTGYTLDPPLRSRFQCRVIQSQNIDYNVIYQNFINQNIKNDPKLLSNVLSAINTLRLLESGGGGIVKNIEQSANNRAMNQFNMPYITESTAVNISKLFLSLPNDFIDP